jgi:DNA-directed RNA polymerase subunit RPC12/RpoP
MECARCKKEVKTLWLDDELNDYVCAECHKKEEGEENVS